MKLYVFYFSRVTKEVVRDEVEVEDKPKSYKTPAGYCLPYLEVSKFLIKEYKKFYEQVDPANAEILYKQVCEQLEQDDEIKDYAQTYSKMKPKEAAAIFDSMTDNLSLVAKILNAMDAQSRGNILGKMDSATAAKVTKIMNPSQN